jgi:hypothetical protein
MIEAVKRLKTSPAQKLIMFILADCHNEKTGQCNPSYRYLMEISGFSNKAIANNLKALKESGALFYDSKNGANSHYLITPSLYKCNADNVTCEAETSEPRSQLKASVDIQSGEPSSQVGNTQPVNLVPEPVNLVPKSSEPSSHKPVLTGEPEPLSVDDAPIISKPLKKPHKKKESTADPRHKPFIEIWCATYERVWEAKYHFQSGKDGKALQTFLRNEKSMTADEWQEFISWIHQTKLTDGKYATGTIKAATGSLAIACNSYNQLITHA